MSSKTLKEEYKEFFKNVKDIASTVGFAILCLLPLISFFVYLLVSGETESSNINFQIGAAIIVNIIYAPIPLWLYFSERYDYTVGEYAIDVLKFFGTIPVIILMFAIPLGLLFLPGWIAAAIIMLGSWSHLATGIIVGIGFLVNIVWVPVGVWLMNQVLDFLDDLFT